MDRAKVSGDGGWSWNRHVWNVGVRRRRSLYASLLSAHGERPVKFFRPSNSTEAEYDADYDDRPRGSWSDCFSPVWLRRNPVVPRAAENARNRSRSMLSDGCVFRFHRPLTFVVVSRDV